MPCASHCLYKHAVSDCQVGLCPSLLTRKSWILRDSIGLVSLLLLFGDKLLSELHIQMFTDSLLLVSLLFT
jgi:hypothetical protein